MRRSIGLVLLFACGCTGPARYLKDRAFDAADPWRANVSLGTGLHANVHATRALALGAGKCDVVRIGMRRGCFGAWRETRCDLNPVIPLLGDTQVLRSCIGTADTSLNRDQLGIDECFPGTLGDASRGWIEGSANLHLLLAGAEIGVDFGEVLDFLLGFACIDLMKDDTRDPFEAIVSPLVPVRLRGVQRLTVSAASGAGDALAKVLCDPEPQVRIAALHALMARGDKAALPIVAVALDDPDPVVRRTAASAVSHLAGVGFFSEDPVREARNWWLTKGKARFEHADGEGREPRE